MAELLDRVKYRMEDDKMPIHLKKHILGVFMSAMHYNSAYTLQYLESKQITAALLQEMFKNKESFKHEYEKKLFIVGLSRMLQCMELPPSLGPLLFTILNELIDMLTNLHEQVSKRVAAAAQREVKAEDEDSDDSSSSLEDDDEGDNNPEEEETKRTSQPVSQEGQNSVENGNDDKEEADMEAENEAPKANNENAEVDHTDSDGDIEGFDHMVS